jgi:hypothetical protein
MTYCVYVDGEEEESGLEKDDALDLEDEILEEDPEAIVTIEPEAEGDQWSDEWNDDDEDEVEEGDS